jgi:site-specific recombinase XerD
LVGLTHSENHVGDAVLVTDEAKKYVNPRQLESYREHRRSLAQWMTHLGKNPEKATGYASSTVKTRMARLDKFYRWTWQNQTSGYTESIVTTHADAWMKQLAHEDYASSYKACCQKAVKTLFKYQRHEQGRDVDWEPVINYSDTSGTDNPRDFLSREERQKIREASLEHGSIPHYNSLTPEERDQWKTYLAQRFEKPKTQVTQSDWDKANSFKTPSMVWTAMDAGLRPIEVQRMKTSWIDTENGVLRIPKEDSSKNKDNWTVSLLDRTTYFLQKWLEERKAMEKYQDSSKVWLTRRSNGYSSNSLNYLLQKLCETAGIKTEKRDITWYSIRHSVGTYMAREEGLAAAQAQLRHKSEKTTMKYDQAPIEDRKNALNKMG